MSFERTRTIRGRRYRYREERTWDAAQKKVRSRSVYLGRVDEATERAMRVAERMAAETDSYQRATFGETGLERKEREAKEREFSQEKFLANTATAPQEKGPGSGPS